eukprot:COSAG03_NODE_25214_length_267_cov_0.607143_1_plen_38_part_10
MLVFIDFSKGILSLQGSGTRHARYSPTTDQVGAWILPN